MNEEKQLRCYIEMVVANKLYALMDAHPTLKPTIAKQLNLQWNNLIKKINYQILHNNRADEPVFAQKVLKEFKKEKAHGMGILQGFNWPRVTAGGSAKSWAYIKKVFTALLAVKEPKYWSLDDSADHVRLLGTVVELIPSTSSIFRNLRGFAMLDDVKASFRDQDAFSMNSRVRVSRAVPLTRDQHARQVNADFINAAKEKGWEAKYGKLDYWIKSATFGNGVSGISGTKLKAGSKVLQVDNLDNLPIGADISGTTADALFSLQVFSSEVIGNRARLEPTVRNLLSPIVTTPTTWVYYGDSEANIKAKIVEIGTVPMSILNLLPVATMVRQYHHTILEVAATMSLYGTMSYQIGYYQSLLGDVLMAQDEEVWADLYDDIEATLKAVDRSIATDFPDFLPAYAKSKLGSGLNQ